MSGKSTFTVIVAVSWLAAHTSYRAKTVMRVHRSDVTAACVCSWSVCASLRAVVVYRYTNCV